MWSAFALLAATAALVSGNAQPQPLAQPLPQPQQYPPPPYGAPGALPPGPGGYPPPGGAYGAYNNTPYQPGLSSASGVPGYPGGNDVFRPVYEWFKIDYAWPDENLKAAALRASQYIPENNALAGIKVWRDRMFLSVPRWKEGVPSTLNSVPAQPRGGSNSPRLDPFPSWEWQELGNCSALQNVHGFEIDSEGRMWVLDSGRVNVKGRTQENRCPPKLVIFDLNTAQFTDNYYNNGYNMNPGSAGYPGPGSVFNDPNRPYDPNRPNQPYGANQPYDPNRPNQPYGSNPPYGANQPYDPNRPNQYGSHGTPYSSNPSDPNYRAPQYSSNPADPNYRPYSSNPADPNYRDPNYRSGYDSNYNDPYHHGGSQYGGAYGSNNPLYRSSPGSRIRVIKSYTFPEEAAQRTSAMLSNIVLDSNDGWYAYITDSSDPDPGIIVFSLAQSRSWKVRDSRSMRSDPRTDSVTINGDRAEIQTNVAGIALSPSGRERSIYYSPLSSTRLYSLPTSVLREPGRDIGGSVNDLGQKLGVSDGMYMDSAGVLYFGVLGESGVARWDSHREQFAAGQRIIARDPRLLQWPDTFAIDQAGNLLAVTNKLQNFLRNRPMDHEPTYRVVRAALGVQSYLSGPGGAFGTAYRPNPGITGSFGDANGGYDPYRAWYLDDANKDQYDPNYKQPTSYDVDGRNYDDPNNNLYDPNYRQPSSFDTTYGAGAGGAYGSQPYGSRGYYGRYNAATAASAPMALVATLMAGVLALGVLADRR